MAVDDPNGLVTIIVSAGDTRDQAIDFNGVGGNLKRVALVRLFSAMLELARDATTDGLDVMIYDDAIEVAYQRDDDEGTIVFKFER
jgi:hypothetical protein